MATMGLSRRAYFETGLDGILRDERQADVFADWSVYLLIGYEQCSLPKNKASLEWIASQLLECLDSGRFATISGRV